MKLEKVLHQKLCSIQTNFFVEINNKKLYLKLFSVVL